MDAEQPGLRLSILGAVVISVFVVLVARLWYLQILAPEQGEVGSQANRIRVLPLEPPRGRIVDIKGRVLVDNRTALVVTVDRHQLTSLGSQGRQDLLLRLATRLTRAGVPTKVADIERRLADPEYSPLLPVPVAIDVPDELMVFLAERTDEFPGVRVGRQSVRNYPNASLAAHVLGYVGRISSEELTVRMGTSDAPKRPPKPYEPDSVVGKTGIERTFEAELRGTPGERRVEVDSRGRLVRVVAERRPLAGNDVQLTVDLDLQRVAEQRLAGQLESLRGTKPTQGSNDAELEAKAGSTVVIDPGNGNVLAMASYPTYDPAEFVNGISADAYRRLSGNGDPELNALINRAITGQYSPGSTFKMISAYAALAKGVINPDTTYNDTGTYHVGNSARRNAEGASNGIIDVAQAITASSDVFFYWIGDQFWSGRSRFGEGIQDIARQFGFGTATGIQLTGESAGVVPDQAWKQRLYDALPPEQQALGDPRWFGGDSANLAIGQGDLLVTPLQLANSYAQFAAGGVRYQPNLVARILTTGTDGTKADLPACDPADPADPAVDLASASHCVVRWARPLEAARLDLPPDLYGAVAEGLAGVTKSPLGTATLAFSGFDQRSFPVLGKTGTIEAGADRAENSAFAAAGPENNARYAAAAYLERAGFGSGAAAPVVRSLFDLVSGQEAQPCTPATRAAVPCSTAVVGPLTGGRP